MYESRIGKFRVKVALRRKRNLGTQIVRERGWILPPVNRRHGQNEMLDFVSPLHVLATCCLVAAAEILAGERFCVAMFFTLRR